MKRGLEEVSVEMPIPKKAKKIRNGEQSVDLPSPADEGERWTKVEKKKKRKISKVESKTDVCGIILSWRTCYCPFHCYVFPSTVQDSPLYLDTRVPSCFELSFLNDDLSSPQSTECTPALHVF